MKQKKPKAIIFADVDKTLRTPKEPMEERVKKLIREFSIRDVLFIYCTGKPCAYMTGAATEWKTPDAWILGSTGSVLYKGTTMPPDDGCEIYPFDKNEIEQFKYFMKEMHKRLCGVKGIFWQPNGEASDFVATPFWGSDMKVKDKVMTTFHECWRIMPHDHMKYFDNVDALDIMVASVDKARGMHWVANMLKVPIQNCYALGDSDNDLPMLLEAKQYGNDFVVGNHKFNEYYEPTHRFAPNDYEGMLTKLLAVFPN